jgi:hypothetical protein
METANLARTGGGGGGGSVGKQEARARQVTEVRLRRGRGQFSEVRLLGALSPSSR